MEEIKKSHQKNVRLDKNLYQVDKYTLRIKTDVEASSFEGHVTIDLSVKNTSLNHIHLHMQNLTVNKFEISFGDKREVGTSHLDESFIDHTYAFKFANEEIKFEANHHYKLLIEYRGVI